MVVVVMMMVGLAMIDFVSKGLILHWTQLLTHIFKKKSR